MQAPEGEDAEILGQLLGQLHSVSLCFDRSAACEQYFSSSLAKGCMLAEFAGFEQVCIRFYQMLFPVVSLVDAFANVKLGVYASSVYQIRTILCLACDKHIMRTLGAAASKTQVRKHSCITVRTRGISGFWV